MGIRENLMFSKVKWKQFKNYSGPAIYGKKKFKYYDGFFNHWSRAVWLVSQVESGGRFGSVCMYDGTGITSGLIQAVAVYPRELANEDDDPADDQGPLWQMLQMIKTNNPGVLLELESELRKSPLCGWKLDNGKVIDLETGNLINGRIIREIFTPCEGTVPKWGLYWEYSKIRALIFHRIFNNQKTFQSQIDYGVKHFKKLAKRKVKGLKNKTVSDILYPANFDASNFMVTDDPTDLAAAVFYSYAINAPRKAFEILRISDHVFKSQNPFPVSKQKKSFHEILISNLAVEDYGRWHFLHKNGRYQRTRNAAMKVWPKWMFKGPNEIMPKSF
jgi:hypothetical protein